MKVLHLAPGGHECGIATYANNLRAYFSSSSVHDFYPIPSKRELSLLTRAEVKNCFNKFVLQAADYDVIHIQNEYGLFSGPGETSMGLSIFYNILKDLSLLKKRVFVTFHSEPVFLKALSLLNFENKKCARIWKKIGRLFKKGSNFTAICHTEVSKNKFVRSRLENAVVIPHGVIERKFNRRKEVSQKNKTVVLSIFGYISDYKGHEFALSIMDLLPENFKLSIIGGRHPNSSGEEIGRILKLAAELGLADRVLITGWVSPSEADYYQQNSDICLAPYQATELSASGAITWSLTSGKPVIASNINSFKDVNIDGQALLLCHLTDRLEWIWAIKKVSEDITFRKRLVNNAKKYCQKNSWANICKQHMELYSQ